MNGVMLGGGMNSAGDGDRPEFYFSADVREIDNGYLVTVSDGARRTQHAFLPSRADKIAGFISQRFMMAMERVEVKA